MKSVHLFFCFVLFTMTASTGAWANVDSSVALNKIHHINESEIQLARLALSKSQSPDVKAFAQHMIDQHTDADAQVQKVAEKEGVALAPFQAADFEQMASDRLGALNGSQFDLSYIGAMDAGHKEALFFLDQLKDGSKDDNLKNLLGRLTPSVKEHEKMAARLKKDLKEKDKKAGGNG